MSMLDIWQKLLQRNGTQGVDVISTFTEEGMNGFLEAHHKYDFKHYTQEFERKFEANGSVRTFKLTIAIEKPLIVEFPPLKKEMVDTPWVLFKKVREEEWIQLQELPTIYRVPAEKSTDPNVRIVCSSIFIKLEWERLDGTGWWTLIIDEITAVAEAFVALVNSSDSASVRFSPTRIYFDVAGNSLRNNLLDSMAQMTFSGKEELIKEESDKFRDLVVILLNIVATEATPRFVNEIKLPAISLANKNLLPALLALEDKSLTLGAGIDRESLRKENANKFNSLIARYNAYLEEDLEALGGINGLVERTKTGDAVSNLEIHLPRSTAFIEKITRLGSQLNPEVKFSANIQAIKKSIGIGVNEFLLDALVVDALPEPKNDCTDWWDPPLSPIRGRGCYWASIMKSDIKVAPHGNGFSVSGTVLVDAGGRLEGCIKRFWDCSWKWVCDDIGLALRGSVGISVNIEDSPDAIVFSAKLDTFPHLETDLPYPFNKIVEAISDLIINGLLAIINFFLALIKFRIVPKTISFADQKTGIVLEGFNAAFFRRSDVPFNTNPIPSKLPFMAYIVDTRFVNTSKIKK